MRRKAISAQHPAVAFLGLMLGMLAPTVSAEMDHKFNDPISRLARIVNPKLAKVEDRVAWLDRKVSTLARYNQFPLKYGLGFRGCRRSESSADPTIIMDLGSVMPIDKVYLVPTQREYLNDSGIFPKKFTVEVADTPDFEHPRLIYRTGANRHRQVGGIPTALSSLDEARYVRLSVQEGHDKGVIDLFGLSEFFVISNGIPVSFNATIETTGNLDTDGLWYPEALIDGRTPLGIWHHGLRPMSNFGDAVLVGDDLQPTIWRTEFSEPAEIDRIILFPYQINRSYEASIFPESLSIELAPAAGAAPVWTREWHNPIPGTTHLTPLVFPVDGLTAGHITVKAIAPWTIGKRRIHGLSEIQVWSGARNLTENLPVSRHHEKNTTRISSLTDGFSSEKTITPIAIWMKQLTERGKIEAELAALRSLYGQLASRSELNVSWGSAVVLGLTFLIPVFLVERRRMQSKEHLDIIRKRIASDLHDDIGSNLGSISLIARTARKDLARLNGPAEIDNDLGEVEMIARESSLAMRDIVWLLERKQDSIGDLVHRMRETAGRLLRETRFTLECTSSKTAAKLTLDAKRHLFLFYKEAIHNVIKHSKATAVSMRLWDEGDQLVMEVMDNGVGLPVTKDRASVSVKKLEDRAQVLKGILQITSSPETGTCIRLLVKRSNLTTHPKAS